MRRLFDLLIPGRARRRTRLLSAIAERTRPPARPARSAGVPTMIRRMPNRGAYYRAQRSVISPGQVRDRRFADRTRRGCDPREVRAFLHLVADELAALAEAAIERHEAVMFDTNEPEQEETRNEE